MTIFEMFGQSGTLAVLGMSVVFSFLLILIFFVSIMGKVIQKLSDGKAAPPSTQASGSAAGPGVISAISAAVNEYQNTENRQ